MVGNYQDAKQYALQLADSLTKIDLMEFFKNAHDQFYPEMDVSFMEYFLEIVDRDGEFVVPHTKLGEYGIMTSTQSSNVKDKLNNLGLVEQQDYLLTDVHERLQSGTKYSKRYTLTPKAFKKCLMRAQRRANQPIDPVIYVDYYLLLEDMVKLYGEYQSGYSNKLLSMKDDKIDALMKKMDIQDLKMEELLNRSKATLDTLDEVQDELGETKATLDNVQDDLTETKEEVKIAKDHLIKKSKVSTRNPKSENKHHQFVATVINRPDGWRKVALTTGTKAYVDRKLTKLISDGHKIVIPEFYTANGFDLRQNCMTEFKKFLKKRLDEINRNTAKEVAKFNYALRVEIRGYNRNHPNTKRSYMGEKRMVKNLKPKDIPIDYKVSWFMYRTNPHISMDDVLKIVTDMHAATQKSPLADEE